MATKKRVKKKIKEDQLVTAAVSVSRWAQEHFNQVIIGVVVLVALIAVAVFTANSRQGSSRAAEVQLSSAMNAFSSGDFESARSSFEQMESRFGGKTRAKARFFKAESELRLGRYADALASFESYLADYSEFPAFRESAMFGQALCHEGLENYQEAAQTLISLMEVIDESDPRYLDAAYQAGEFLAHAGDFQTAGEYFQMVADKATGNLKDRAEVSAALVRR